MQVQNLDHISILSEMKENKKLQGLKFYQQKEVSNTFKKMYDKLMIGFFVVIISCKVNVHSQFENVIIQKDTITGQGSYSLINALTESPKLNAEVINFFSELLNDTTITADFKFIIVRPVESKYYLKTDGKKYFAGRKERLTLLLNTMGIPDTRYEIYTVEIVSDELTELEIQGVINSAYFSVMIKKTP